MHYHDSSFSKHAKYLPVLCSYSSMYVWKSFMTGTQHALKLHTNYTLINKSYSISHTIKLTASIFFGKPTLSWQSQPHTRVYLGIHYHLNFVQVRNNATRPIRIFAILPRVRRLAILQPTFVIIVLAYITVLSSIIKISKYISAHIPVCLNFILLIWWAS